MKSDLYSRRVEQSLIQIAIKIARRGDGALFVVVSGKKPQFRVLVKQNIKPFSVADNKNEKLVESLAIIDGALIVDSRGKLVAYGTMIKNAVPFKGFGTRHAAAISASRNNNTAILASEEERKVKIFKNGKYIMQLDALEKGIEKKVLPVSKFLESIGAGFLGTVGAATLIPSLGISILPGVIIFGGSYYAIKSLFDSMSKE